MITRFLIICLWLGMLPGFGLPTAYDGTVNVEPPSLALSGAPGTAAAANLRLTAGAPISALRVSCSQLACVDENNLPLPALTAAAVSLDPPYIKTMAPGESAALAASFTLPEKTGVCSGSLALSWAGSAAGQLAIPVTLTVKTLPVLQVQNPDALTVNGWQRAATYTFPFTLKETAGGSPLTDLSAGVGDFMGPQGQVTLTSSTGSAVVVEINNSLPGGETLNGKVNFYLAQVPAGSYSGQVLFTSGTRYLAALPITLNVRQPWWWAGLALALGVALGLWLSFYKETGRPRYELISRIGSLKKDLLEDQQLAHWFGPGLLPVIHLAETALEKRNFTEGAVQAGKAEQYVASWKAYDCNDWLKQLTYLRDDLLPRLKALLPSGFGKQLLVQAEDLLARAAEQASPQALKERLQATEAVLARHATLQEGVRQLETLIHRLPPKTPPEKAAAVQVRHAELKARLEAQVPVNEDAWKSLEQDLRRLMDDVCQLIKEYSERLPDDGWGKMDLWQEVQAVAARVLPDVGCKEAVSVDEGQRAARAILFWTVVSYALGGALLALAGYATLYLANNTFGAQPLTDYGGLLLWGLTGQAGFTAVADWIRGLGLPFLK